METKPHVAGPEELQITSRTDTILLVPNKFSAKYIEASDSNCMSMLYGTEGAVKDCVLIQTVRPNA